MTVAPDDPTRFELLFRDQLNQGLHHGAQLAVYRDGEQVADLAGGVTGPDGEEVTSDQRFVFFSSTKPLTAACVHQLVEAGELDYDEPVATYWPEFAERGDGPKDEVTVRHVLSHQGGFPASGFDLRPDDWTDWDAVVEAMETIDLTFDPGTTAAYHALNYGWVLGELVRRRSGQSIGSYVQENVFDPLGMDDTYLGLPDDVEDDVATLSAFDPFERCREPPLGVEADHSDAAANFNREDFHRAEMPAANAVGTASDLARFYACLVNGGELDGTRILEADTIDRATSPQIEVEEDGTIGAPVRYGMGFFLGGTPTSNYGTLVPKSTFGHGGMGSSVGWGDAADDIAFAYVTNGMRAGYEHRTRCAVMGDAARRAFGK